MFLEIDLLKTDPLTTDLLKVTVLESSTLSELVEVEWKEFLENAPKFLSSPFLVFSNWSHLANSSNQLLWGNESGYSFRKRDRDWPMAMMKLWRWALSKSFLFLSFSFYFQRPDRKRRTKWWIKSFVAFTLALGLLRKSTRYDITSFP